LRHSVWAFHTNSVILIK